MVTAISVSVAIKLSLPWLTVSIAAGALAGCQEPPSPAEQSNESALVSTNGLTMINGLTMTNGLSMTNGLTMINGLTMTNGLSSTVGLMTSAGGRNTVSYLVRCALPAGTSITKQDQNGASYTFAGAIGLAPEWANGGCGQSCQQLVSACMLAHVNTASIHVPIYMVAQAPSVGWGQNSAYPNQEGTFFGNIFYTNTVGHVDAYYCNGPGFNTDVVAGRIGSAQTNAPYRNLFASGYCNINGCVPSDAKSSGAPDGYKACTMGDGATRAWNNSITVWRQNKALDASGNVVAGKTADGKTVRYDFEGSVNGWTSSNSALTLSSCNEKGAQTGSSALKINYTSGSSSLRILGPSGLSLPAGTNVSIYLYVASDSKVTSANPFVRTGGSNESTHSRSSSTLLKGSWNVVTVAVPSGATGNQVGFEFQTDGAFTAYIDGVTW